MKKRIAFISDTHSLHDQVNIDLTDIDFLVHTGDMSSRGKESEIHSFNKWIGKLGLDKEHVIVISGNHDWFFERHDRKRIKEVCTNFTYLQEDRYECDGLKFYGAPHQPFFYNWAFNVIRGEALRKIWAKIPDDTDVLLTHGPPMGILDKNEEGEECGCEELTKRVGDLNLKIHAFGHIHEGHGIEEINGTTFVNASNLNRRYMCVYEPTIVEVNL